MEPQKLLKNTIKFLLAIIFACFFYQATGAIHIGEAKSAYFHFSFIYRACVIGIFWSFLFREKKLPVFNVLGSALSILVGALISKLYGPLFSNVYGHSFVQVIILEIGISVGLCAVLWFFSKSVSQKTITLLSIVALVIFVGSAFLQMSSFYTKPGTRGYDTSHTYLKLSHLKYDGYDYAETINRMNKLHQPYYKAYQDAWAGDNRVQPFSSIMFFRPSGMPTLYALMLGKTLYSVFLWFGALLVSATIGSYLIFRRYLDEGFSFISAMSMGSIMLLYGCTALNNFSWTMAETTACLVIICALSFLLNNKWWPAAALFVLAATSREFTLMLLPAPLLYAFLSSREERKKAILPLVFMMVGVICFYLFHYISAPVADAGTQNKFNYIGSWFKGSSEAYKSYFLYRLNATWPFGFTAICLPAISLVGSLLIKGKSKAVWIYITLTLTSFYALMGQNIWQNYWGAFGIPLLFMSALMIGTISKQEKLQKN